MNVLIIKRNLNRQITKTVDNIRKKFHPEKIILFGSYAYGKPDNGSDVDLMVIMNTHIHPRKQAVEIRKALTSSIAIDILVRTPDYIATRLEMGDFFIQDIMKKGIVLYEENNRRMDQ